MTSPGLSFPPLPPLSLPPLPGRHRGSYSPVNDAWQAFLARVGLPASARHRAPMSAAVKLDDDLRAAGFSVQDLIDATNAGAW